MESFQFIAPARVKVSLVPIGGIGRRDFLHYSKIILSVKDIRLLDLAAIPNSTFFNPQEFPQGKIFYSLSSGLPCDETAFLDDFEPFRKTFIVVGVGLHRQCIQKQQRDLDALKAQYPSAIVHNIIYHKSLAEESSHGVFHINEDAEKISTSIEAVMCGVTQNFLTALHAYVSSYDSITLRSPVSLEDSRVLIRSIPQAQKKHNSGLSFKALFANGQSMPSSSKDVSLKTLQRQTGRRNKLMGNFLLLAGKARDALQYFTDAAINAKKVDDHLWLASALEGIAVSVVVLLYLGLPYQIHNPMFATILHLPKLKGLPKMIPTKISMESVASNVAATPRNSTSSSLNLNAVQSSPTTEIAKFQIIELILLLVLRSSHYYKASTADVEDCAPDVVFVESLLRNAKFMVSAYLSDTSDTTSTIGALMGFEPIKRLGNGGCQYLLKNSVILEIDLIFSLELSQLELGMKCKIYCALASIYDDLGLRRKHGLVLRLLLDSILPQIPLIQSDLEKRNLGSMDSIKDILETLFKIYHLHTDPERSRYLASRHYSDWIVLQLLLIKMCLRVAEAFKDYDTLTKLCVLTLSRFTHCLPLDDQITLRDKLLKLSRDEVFGCMDVQAPHADPFLVRDARFVPLTQTKDHLSYAFDELNLPQNWDQRNLGIYDPFIKSISKSSTETIICQNEVYSIKLFMQNPFLFPLDVRSVQVVANKDSELETIVSTLSLVHVSPLQPVQYSSNHSWKNVPRVKKLAEEINAQSESQGFTIPPLSVAEAAVKFKPLAPGSLEIKGFDVVLGGSNPQFFYVADNEISSGFEKSKHDSFELSIEPVQVLENIISNLLDVNPGNRTSRKTINLVVIASQPTLVALNDPTLKDWLMLLEGEIQSGALHLKNCSTEEVNHLSISFWDSTYETANLKLNTNAQQNTLSAAEIYELELLSIGKHALSITNKAEITSKYKVIPPQTQMQIKYEISGKRAMTELNLILEYGRKVGDSKSNNFLKTLVVPFNLTVHRSMELVGNDVIPSFTHVRGTLELVQINQISDASSTALSDFMSRVASTPTESLSDYCVLILDIKNFWKDSMTVKILGDPHVGGGFLIESSIAPTKVSRIFLPIKRIDSSILDPLKTIPSLRNKQFIKNYNMREEDEIQARKIFWVKNEVLKHLKALWSTGEGSETRSGELNLRRLNLSPTMCDLLLRDDILISHTVFSEESSEDVEIENKKVILEREKFYILKSRITNHTNSAISGTLRHIPFPTHVSSRQDLAIDQKILYNGVLQTQIGRYSLGPGDMCEKELGFLILEKGQYEWGCVFETSGENIKATVGREPLYFTVL